MIDKRTSTQHTSQNNAPILRFHTRTYRFKKTLSHLLDELDEVLEDVAAALVCDDCGGEVPQDVRAHRLDGIAVLGLVQKQVDDAVPTLRRTERKGKVATKLRYVCKFVNGWI